MNHAVRRLKHDLRASNQAKGSPQTSTRGADYHSLREFNRLLVLNAVREFGPIARVAIAHELGLSRTTVSSIIDVLLQEGFVVEGGTLHAAPAGGRRAIQVKFKADVGVVLGIDIGRSHLTFLITNLSGAIIAEHFGPFDTALGPGVCLPKLVEQLRLFAASQGITWDRVVGVGVGIPGPMDSETGVLISPPAMPGWEEVNVAKWLEHDLDCPVYIDNDANMGALGESRYGVGRGISDMAYVKLGTGIGCGLIVRGQIYRGCAGSAGEIGHMIIDEDGPVCECGNHGCLESLASAHAIVANARQDILPTQPTFIQDAAATEVRSDIDIVEVIQAALAGNAACQAAIERAGGHIGIALAGMINLVNPSAIVIDGGIARAGALLLDPLARSAAQCSLPGAWKRTAILAGELGNTAIGLGAVAVVIDAAFGPPAHVDRLANFGNANGLIPLKRSRALPFGEEAVSSR